jgi:type I restriction-modification system DNA methylase subunit
MEQYSTLTQELSKSIDKATKKRQGIFITPRTIIETMAKLINKYMKNVNTILEPSCGSCEIINYFDSKYKSKKIVGIELNDTIFDRIKNLKFKNDVKLLNIDYLTYDNDDQYDLIIGNPPYFVMPKNMVNKQYYSLFDGRPNIFIIFLIHSLPKLAKNGILSFILPKNFLNCLYYDKLRNLINKNYTILDIHDTSSEKFIDTQQDTMIFTIQNKKPKSNNKWVMEKQGYTIFNDNISILQSYYEGSTLLDTMGFHVKVGNIVWNQVKDKLTSDSSKTLLVYSGNIKDNKLQIQNFSNEEKKQYINVKGKMGPTLIVNRGYGNGEYKFNYAIINPKQEYLCENHIICIIPKNEMAPDTLMANYEKITNSFENEKTKEFIKYYFANNGINTVELQTVLPIY